MSDEKEAPSAKSLSGEGYNQTYVILSAPVDTDSKLYADSHEVFFRCGNWCYKGYIQFGGLSISTNDLPTLIPALQRQQGSLRYYCNSKSMPSTSEFSDPVSFLHNAIDFMGEELISERIDAELRKMSAVFPWINDESAKTYFELSLANVPSYMDKHTVYVVIQPGDGDQALLDVRFPDVSSHGQGLLLACYNDTEASFRKLTLWHCVGGSAVVDPKVLPKIRTLSVSSNAYQQTYCIMQSTWDKNSPALSVHHDVLFRFGSWCYAGRVQLTPSLSLSDIPFVIPALRMQQSRLDFVFDTNNIPTSSPFAPCLEYAHRIAPLIDNQIANSEDSLRSLIDRLSKMGLGESIARWLEGDSQHSFFEFKLAVDPEMTRALNNIELVASKVYHASGIVTVTIIFQNTIYVTVADAAQENPLLDSRFPDVSGKGRGYQVNAYPQGAEDWPALRKVSVWQTVGALEQEFRDRAVQLAQSKLKEEAGGGGAVASSSSKGDLEPDSTNLAISAGPESDISGSAASGSANDSATLLIADGPSSVVSPVSAVSADLADDSFGTPVKAEAKGVSVRHSPMLTEVHKLASPAELGISNLSVSSPGGAGGKEEGTRMARPHHVPKLDSLSKRMDEIRKSMAQQGGGLAAPWDSKGKPILDGGMEKK